MADHIRAQLIPTDGEIEALAKKYIAPYADRLDGLLKNPMPYQQTEQFRRVKALIVDALSKLRVPVADVQPVAYLHKNNLTLTWPGKLTEVQLNSGVWRALYEHPPVASAPVADESPMAKMADALREKARQEQQAYQDSRVQSTEWGPMPHGTEADLPASAPVADERAAQEYGSPADVAQRIEHYLAHDGRMNSGTQLLYEAMKALRGLARGSK